MNPKVIYLVKRMARLFPKKYRVPLGMAFFRLFSLLYTGNAVACSCCGGHFRRFMGRRWKLKATGICPRCLSLERHRLLSLYLRERTNLFTEKLKLLHFAPELCYYYIFSGLPNLDYITADLDSPLADIQMDITDICYPDNEFDVILCYHVLEHVVDDRKALAELYRVLKPNGWGIIQSPMNTDLDTTLEDARIATPEARLQMYGHHDHKRLYGRDYQQRLEQAGFVVSIEPYVRSLPDAVIRRFGLMSNEDIYVVTKPEIAGR